MPSKKLNVKKQSFGPISQQAISLRANPDTVKAIEDYQAYMLKTHNLMVSTNKAINALIVNGMQFVRECQTDPAHAEAA